jgi:hypothetical protein
MLKNKLLSIIAMLLISISINAQISKSNPAEKIGLFTAKSYTEDSIKSLIIYYQNIEYKYIIDLGYLVFSDTIQINDFCKDLQFTIDNIIPILMYLLQIW